MNDTEPLPAETPAANPPASLPAPAGTPLPESQPGLLPLEPQTDGGSKAAAPKSRGGLGGTLRKLLGRGENVGCTCGRKPGVQGRHKKDCALFSESAPKHFTAPDLSKPDALPAGSVDPVSPVPVAPADFSFWGRVAKTVLRTRERLKVRRIKKKCEPVIGEVEAAACANEMVLPEKDVEEFAACAVKCAEHYGVNPQHAPLMDLGLQWFNIESHMWAAEARIDARLKKIQESKGAAVTA